MKPLQIHEHRTQILVGKVNPELPEACVLEEQHYNSIDLSSRRCLRSEIFPYKLRHIPEKNCYEVRADYYIGLDWLVEGIKAIQVQPKINAKLLELYNKEILTKESDLPNPAENKEAISAAIQEAEKSDVSQLNYLQMLFDVYTADIDTKDIGNLVEIYWDAKQISIEQKDDHLTPFLVAQFLLLLKKIVRKGLKKSYYRIQQNLSNRARGKILVGQQIKQNVFRNRLTNIVCDYQVFGEDSEENRFLKKVFKFAVYYVENHREVFGFRSAKKLPQTFAQIEHIINFCRPAFEHISSELNESQLKNFKHNPFFSEYKEAIQLGNYILKRFGYNISSAAGTLQEIPPFWIDMPRLFELYVYVELLNANNNEKNKIIYQFGTYGNYLDILIKDGDNSMVIDTKYKLQYDYSLEHQDIRQVAGYARLKRVREEVDIKEDKHLKCLIVYPAVNSKSSSLKIGELCESRITQYYEVYKLGVSLPVI